MPRRKLGKVRVDTTLPPEDKKYLMENNVSITKLLGKAVELLKDGSIPIEEVMR